MKNVTCQVVGRKIRIECDLDEATCPSTSGKSNILASSEGNVDVPTPNGVAKLGLNLYFPVKK